MSLSEEIRSMEAQGIPQEEIVRILQNQGISLSEINNALSASKIKRAVSQESSSATEIAGEELQPSITSQQQPPVLQGEKIGEPSQAYSYEQAAPSPSQYQEYQQYPSYDQYSSGVSADTINEIAEQVMLEKLIPLREKLEQALEFRNLIETKVNYIDERLKKIEQVISRLQASILQKVGDYMSNIEDIKNEMHETQKSFRYLLDNPNQKPFSPPPQSAPAQNTESQN